MGPKALDISSQENLPIKHGDIVGIEKPLKEIEWYCIYIYIYVCTHSFVPIPPRAKKGICLNQTGSDNLMSLRQSEFRAANPQSGGDVRNK